MPEEIGKLYTELFKAANQSIVEKSQHFNPFFSWVAVTFTYFTIGIRGGKVWKYLFYCSTAGFIATALSMTSTLADNLNYRKKDFYLLKYIEGFLWTLTEWGYTYINFIKTRSCIKSLKKPFWNVIMILILIYSEIIRVILSFLDYSNMGLDEETKKLRKKDYDKKKDFWHGCVFLPLGLISLIFIYFIIKEFIEETDKKNKDVISILLHSTLTRMIFVSLIFICLSVVVHIPQKYDFWYCLRTFLWRLKGDLGIIFLVDMLLLRIDLDHNQLIAQSETIEQLNIEKSIPLNHKKDSIIDNLKVPGFDEPEEVEDYVPNAFIQENTNNNINYNSQEKHSRNKSMSQEEYNIMKEVQENYIAGNINYNNYRNSLNTINSINTMNNSHSNSNSNSHSQSNNNQLISPLYSPMSSPGSTHSKLFIDPTGFSYNNGPSLNMRHSRSPSSPSNDFSLMSPYRNKTSYPSNTSLNTSSKSLSNNNVSSHSANLSSSSSSDELICTRSPKNPKRKNPGNIIMEKNIYP